MKPLKSLKLARQLVAAQGGTLGDQPGCANCDSKASTECPACRSRYCSQCWLGHSLCCTEIAKEIANRSKR